MTFFIALEIVSWCKKWFMCHFYSPCFEYLESYVFFPASNTNQLFVSQGNIKFDKKAKIQVLQTFEGIFHTSLTWSVIYRRFIKFFQNDANRPILHLLVLYHFYFKTIPFSKWRKLSDPSFMGASSNFCEMTQIVRSFIYGCLRHFVLKLWWSAHKWRVGRFVSFCKIHVW